MPDNQLESIFRAGSQTYYWTSLYFPTETKNDVFRLYAFVRTADNFIDQLPQDRVGFQQFKDTYYSHLQGQSTTDPIILEFVDLFHRKQFQNVWVDAFFAAMNSDLGGITCHTLQDTIDYMHGSAEVIGLMMATILQLPLESYPAAQMLGRAMQYANFIRDIHEDNGLNRQYLPLEELHQYHLPDLQESTTRAHPQAFIKFIHTQISHYHTWQDQAQQGYQYIPKRCLIPIKTAADMYTWTVDQIAKDPFIVYQKKLKPTKSQIIAQALKNHL